MMGGTFPLGVAYPPLDVDAKWVYAVVCWESDPGTPQEDTMLTNPSHPIIEPSTPDDHSAVARMWADWCRDHTGAKTEMEHENGYTYVYAELYGPDGGLDRVVTAEFDGITGRFTGDCSVITECEQGSASTLKELANALRTGHRRGGHR